MQIADIEAIYEHGLLKLPAALPLPNGQKVKVTIQSLDGVIARLVGSVQWHGTTDDLDALINNDENDPVETARNWRTLPRGRAVS